MNHIEIKRGNGVTEIVESYKGHAYAQCPQCGNSPLQESGEEFCFRDGSKLVFKFMQCASCYKILDWRREKFCTSCGVAASKATVKVVED
jgi:hypothetical protein